MDFAALPPEINSGRMYAGPGSEPMLTAAAAWDRLAAELQGAASSYGSVITGLTSGSWRGPTSAAMAAAAAPYATWISTTAAQAEQTATQARAAAAAYETAFAATVPPPVITANRTRLASLTATNILGQNTAAIMATEAEYAQFWAQDAAAMYGYAGSSAAASQMPPFSTPPQTTNPAGHMTQAAAVTQAGGASAATSGQGIVSQLLELLAAAGTRYNATVSQLLNSLFGVPYASQVYNNIITLGFAESKMVLPANDSMISTIMGMVIFQRLFHPVIPFRPDIASLLPALGAGLGAQAAPALSSAESAVTAGVGRAGLVGAMSVPPSWAAATPAIRMVASALPGTAMGAAPAVLAGSPGSLFGEMALSGLVGRALAGSATGAGGRVASRKKGLDPARLERVVKELQKNPDNPAVQHWHADKDGLESLLAELSQKPGIHAVHVSKNKNKPTPPRSQSG